MVKDTCEGKECRMWQLLDGYCPMRVDNFFTPPGGGQPVLVHDCAPKRQLLMEQENHARLVALQQVWEQNRNLDGEALARVEVLSELLAGFLSVPPTALSARVQQRLDERRQLLLEQGNGPSPKA